MSAGDPIQYRNFLNDYPYGYSSPNFGTAYGQWMPFSPQQQWPLDNFNWDCTGLSGWSETTLELTAKKAELEAENCELKAELEKTQDELSKLTKQVHADDLELDKLAIHLVENYLDLMDKYPQEEASDVDLAIFVMEQLEEEAEFHNNASLETVDFYENIIENHGERLKEYFAFTDGEVVYDGLEYSNKLVEVFHVFIHKLCKILRKQGGKEFYQMHAGQDICEIFEKLLQIMKENNNVISAINQDVTEAWKASETKVRELKEQLDMIKAIEPIPLSDHDRVPQTSEKQKCSKCSGKGLVKNVFGKYRPCPDC